MILNKGLVIDAVERAGSTFGEAFLTALGGNVSGIVHIAIWKDAIGAGVAAVLALGKGLLAGQTGIKGSASLSPAIAGAAGGAAGAAAGAAVGSAVGNVLGGAGEAVEDTLKGLNPTQGDTK